MDSAEEDRLVRKVGEAVQNDSMLIERTAVEIARALNLEGNNRTLGRKFVRMALASNSVDVLKEKSSDYGNIRKELLAEIFHDVKQKYNNILLQIRDADAHGEESIFGFSGKTETLNLASKQATRGGLISKSKGSHVFQKPEKSVKGISLLGLDRANKERLPLAVPSTIGDQEDAGNDIRAPVSGECYFPDAIDNISQSVW